MSRYTTLVEAFVGLADTLVSDYDAVDLGQRLIDAAMEILPISAAGILLASPPPPPSPPELRVFATSSEHTRLLELLQLEANAGPCLQAYHSGLPVLVKDLTVDSGRWPAFADRAAQYGYISVAALPMRLRNQRVGALNLFGLKMLSISDIAVGQGLADVATIGILHARDAAEFERVNAEGELVNQQLQAALKSRVVIEQAKGILAERGHVDVDSAFQQLRNYARREGWGLADLARAVVESSDTYAEKILQVRPHDDKDN